MFDMKSPVAPAGSLAALSAARALLERDRSVASLDVRRAADALLRRGVKPSVAAVRGFLGGGSPNTIAPLLVKYWENLGERLQSGPDALEHVPEALARVTEHFWRRALEEARERLKGLPVPDLSITPALQDQVVRLSTAVAEARAREGEHLTHLNNLSNERDALRGERSKLLALLKSTQELLRVQTARISALENRRAATPAAFRGGRKCTAPPRPKLLPALKLKGRSKGAAVRRLARRGSQK
jgi:hypothetical protein